MILRFKIVLIISLTLLAINGHAQDCNIISKANDIKPDKLCAPVSVDWEATYRGVNDGGTGNVAFEYDWNDGNPPVVVPAINTNIALKEWRTTLNHIYPLSGNFCVYHPTVTLVVNGVHCTSSIQQQIVTVWDTDDFNGGHLVINPIVFPICVGNDGTVTFQDASNWNCTPPVENDVINNRNRWVQWIYGTSGNIFGAQIGGVVRPWPYVDAINYVPAPVMGPIAPFNTSMPIYIPLGYNVGDYFEITLRNWNVCNPYDDPTIPGPPVDIINGDHDPLITTAAAIIVAYPDATIAPVGPFCSNNNSVNLSAATAGGTWSGVGITNATAGTFNPSVAGAGLHNISYSVTNANGCTGTDMKQIRVHDTPKTNLNVGMATNLCPGVIQQLDGNPTGGLMPYTHLWTGDTTPLSSIAISNPIFQTMVIDTFNLSYRVVDANGCIDQTSLSVIIDTANIYFNQPTMSICTNIATAIDPKVNGGTGIFTVHQWSGDSIHLLSATNIANPIMTATVPGTYKFLYYVKSNQGCDASDSVTVEVLKNPVVNAGADKNNCGYENQLDGTITNGIGEWIQKSGPGHSVFSSINNPKSTVSIDMYGTYRYRWMASSLGCSDSSFVNITFIEIPNTKVMNPKDTCALTTAIIAYPDLGIGHWGVAQAPPLSTVSFGNNLLPQTTFATDASGIYQLYWHEDNLGCSNSDTVDIEFHLIPQAILAPFDLNGCNEYTINFQNLSTNADGYLWAFGDGTTAIQKDATHTYANQTINMRHFNGSMRAATKNGCSDSLTFTISVAPSPIARFKPDVTIGCPPLNVNFNNTSMGAKTYNWQFNDGSLPSSDFKPSHLFYNNEKFVQAYEVILAVENEFFCVDTARSFITVYPKLDIDFAVTPLSGCSPLKVGFVADQGAFTYQWQFGDGATFNGISSLSHVYNATTNTAQQYTAKLFTTSVFGCADTSEHQIEVKPSPKAIFNMSASEGCSPILVQFDNQSTGASFSTWKFDDGTTTTLPNDADINHTFANNGYSPNWNTIRLVVESSLGCTDSIERNIQVFPQVGAAIGPVSPGCSPYLVRFDNNTISARTFTWNYGDGHTSVGYLGSNMFNHQADTVVNFTVRLTATSNFGCVETAQTTVTVLPTPDANFTPDPTEQFMPNSTFTFNNQTVGSGWNYNWKFGDGLSSTDKNPVHTYNNSGTYNVILVVNGSLCSDSIDKKVKITPMVPEIIVGPDASGCPPLQVEFFNQTKDATSYFWEFGDGNSSEAKEPVHVYHRTGSYKVKLTADGPGGRSIADNLSVVVFEDPIATFTLDPRVSTIPGPPVKFTDESIGTIERWNWDFGDGGISTDANPLHEYTEIGTFDIALIVTNENGCTDEFLMTEAVATKPGGEIKFPNAFTPNLSGSNGGTYDDKTVQESNFVFYPYTVKGIMEYKLQIFTRWGELIFESIDVDIGWDGYLNGHLCEQGVYIFKAVVKFSNGSTKVQTGDVTLLR